MRGNRDAIVERRHLGHRQCAWAVDPGDPRRESGSESASPPSVVESPPPPPVEASSSPGSSGSPPLPAVPEATQARRATGPTCGQPNVSAHHPAARKMKSAAGWLAGWLQGIGHHRTCLVAETCRRSGFSATDVPYLYNLCFSRVNAKIVRSVRRSQVPSSQANCGSCVRCAICCRPLPSVGCVRSARPPVSCASTIIESFARSQYLRRADLDRFDLAPDGAPADGANSWFGGLLA